MIADRQVIKRERVLPFRHAVRNPDVVDEPSVHIDSKAFALIHGTERCPHAQHRRDTRGCQREVDVHRLRHDRPVLRRIELTGEVEPSPVVLIDVAIPIVGYAIVNRRPLYGRFAKLVVRIAGDTDLPDNTQWCLAIHFDIIEPCPTSPDCRDADSAGPNGRFINSVNYLLAVEPNVDYVLID